MLVAQAYKASIVFKGGSFSLESSGKDEDELIEHVTKSLESEMMNITLVGMPGSGKSRIGKKLSNALNRPFVDLDDAFTEEYGVTPAEVIKTKGESDFRNMETELAKKILPRSGLVIATGGGIVTRPENFFYLRANSKVIYIKRPLETLKNQNVSNRPVSQNTGIVKLFELRSPLYEAVCDEKWDLPDFIAGDPLVDSLIEKITKTTGDF